MEHRDRSARFADEFIEAALSVQGRTLIVVDDAEADDDPVRDMTEMLTSFCACRYDKRAVTHRASRTMRAGVEA